MSDKIEQPIAKIATDIVLVDVVGYSLLTNEDQLFTVEFMSDYIPRILSFWSGLKKLRDDQLLLGFISTGDGFYVILNPEMRGYGVFLGLSLRNYLLWQSSNMNGLYQGVRVTINSGVVLPFTDMNGCKNYVGDGLNDCSRLLSIDKNLVTAFCEDLNFIVASESAYSLFSKLYSGHKAQIFLSTIRFKKSKKILITDKHEKIHPAYLLDSSRYVAIQPPKLKPDT